jgi:hypothetical protein
MHLPNKTFLERYAINSNPGFTTDLRTAGAERSLLLVAAYSPVTPGFTRKTECISRVRQDQFTHT